MDDDFFRATVEPTKPNVGTLPETPTKQTPEKRGPGRPKGSRGKKKRVAPVPPPTIERPKPTLEQSIEALNGFIPKRPQDWKNGFSILGARINEAGRFPPSKRLSACIQATEHHVMQMRGYSYGSLGALMALIPTMTHLFQYRDAIRPVLERNREVLRLLMTVRALQLWEDLPNFLKLYRSSEATLALGWTWCSSAEAARQYSRLPPFLTANCVLTEVMVSKETILFLSETHAGFEAITFPDETNLVSKTELHYVTK